LRSISTESTQAEPSATSQQTSPGISQQTEMGTQGPPEICIRTAGKSSWNWRITPMQETQGGAVIIMLMQPCTVARVPAFAIIPFLESSSIRVSKKRNSQQVRRSAKALKGGVVALSQRESDKTSPWYAFSRTAEPLTRPLPPSRSYST